MPTIEDGLNILAETVKGKKTHKHYDRVTDLATLYKQLITGEDVGKLLRRFSRREDETMFAQRVTMTQVITPAVAASIMNPFYKVPRVNSVIEKLDFENTESFDEKKKNIEEALSKFNGDKSLKEWMESRFVEISFTDPNAFVITEFDAVPIGPQGEMTKRVEPRPFEVSSKEAINFKYKNNILQWLIIKESCKYKLIDKEEDGYSYTIYLDNNAIKFEQIDPARSSIGDGLNVVGEETYFRISENELYLVLYFDHKAGVVPARRVGYKNDLVTDGKTFVNPFHDGLPYFMKSIKTVSEFDITMCIHAFPQKFQYGPACPGQSESITCHAGSTPEGGKCGICGGTGIAIHTTAHDAVTLRIPKDKTEMIDLQTMVHYESPPIAIVEFQNKYILQLKAEVISAVFPQVGVVQTYANKTATELDYAYESVYDALFPFAGAYSSMYKHIVKVSARFRDINDIIIEYKFPKDFKFKTVSELLDELKKANDSNAPGYVRQEITSDIIDQQFVDKPTEIKKIKVKQLFFPFPDKSQTEIVLILTNNLTPDYNKILWANFDNIFSELEQDQALKNIYFYDLAFEKQKELLKEKVSALMLEVEPEQAQVFGATEEERPT